MPVGFPAGVHAIQHLLPQHPSGLAKILDGRIALPVRTATDGPVEAIAALLRHAHPMNTAWPAR